MFLRVTYEALGEKFEGDTADTSTEKARVREEGLTLQDMGAGTPIGLNIICAFINTVSD